MRYQVNSQDVCVSGMERLRSNNEFILFTPINANSEAGDILNGLLIDIKGCMSDEFDHHMVEIEVYQYWLDNVKPLFEHNNPFQLGFFPEDEESCNFYLYIEQTPRIVVCEFVPPMFEVC